MTDQPTEDELNALDITDAEAVEMNALAHPFVADPAPDADNDLVKIDALPSGVVFVTINRPEKRNAFDAALVGKGGAQARAGGGNDVGGGHLWPTWLYWLDSGILRKNPAFTTLLNLSRQSTRRFRHPAIML